MAPSSGKFQNSDMASKQPEIINVPDDDDFPNSGPQNPVEAQSYKDKLNAIMETFTDLLANDHKDALRSTITSLKKLMVKHWWQMAKADIKVVLRSVMKVAAWLMIQINVPEHYLSPVQDTPLKMTAEECLSWLEKVLLPRPASLTWEQWYGPTWLLAAVVWLHLKCKFFNGSTAKEACTMFEVQAKKLSKLLSGRVYLGGSTGATKGK